MASKHILMSLMGKGHIKSGFFLFQSNRMTKLGKVRPLALPTLCYGLGCILAAVLWS